MSFGFTSRLVVLVVLVVLAFGTAMHLPGALMTPEQRRDYEAEMRQVTALEHQSNNIRHTNDQRTLNQLQSLSVHGVRWPNCDIQVALADLEAWSKEADPAHVGIRFVLKMPVDPARPDVLGRPVQRLVCIIVSDKMTFASLLLMMSHDTNLAYKVTPGCVTFEQWQPDDFFSGPYDIL